MYVFPQNCDHCFSMYATDINDCYVLLYCMFVVYSSGVGSEGCIGTSISAPDVTLESLSLSKCFYFCLSIPLPFPFPVPPAPPRLTRLLCLAYPLRRQGSRYMLIVFDYVLYVLVDDSSYAARSTLGYCGKLRLP